MLSLHGLQPGHLLPTRGINCLDHFMLKLDINNLSAHIAIFNTTVTDHAMIFLNLCNAKMIKCNPKIKNHCRLSKSAKYT